jgi:hypothetical protein
LLDIRYGAAVIEKRGLHIKPGSSRADMIQPARIIPNCPGQFFRVILSHFRQLWQDRFDKGRFIAPEVENINIFALI